MLIYNHLKKFIGIDEQCLKIFGFSDLSGLQTQADDFADFFVKEPGFIHDFKHVHWIDFITCSEESEKPKALIRVNSKNFRCNLDVTTLFLNESPSSKAYLIHLQNIKELTDHGEILVTVPTFGKSTLSIETPIIPTLEIVNEKVNEIKVEPTLIEEIQPKAERDKARLEIQLEEQKEYIRTPLQAPEPEVENYFYDPQIASDELGLPIELIEEFIQDFIAQTEEFKAQIYTSFENGDMKNVKTLSHKLKGVAANLRIEDALEALRIINTSENLSEIKSNLDLFYKIMPKYSDKNIFAAKAVPEPTLPKAVVIATPVSSKDDEDLVIDFKDNFVENTVVKVSKREIKLEEDDLIIDFKYDPEDILEKKVDAFVDSLPLSEPSIRYSKKQAAHEIGLDNESFDELFNDYIFESKALSNLIHHAINSENLGMWKNDAAKLKGMNDNMRVYDLQEELETLINTQDRAKAKEAIQQIDLFIEKISHKS